MTVRAIGFVMDDARQSIIEKIKRRVGKSKSILIHGDFGVGKSALKDYLIQYYKDLGMSVVDVEGGKDTNQVFFVMSGGDILQDDPKPRLQRQYINQVRRKKQIIFLDEAHRLNPKVWHEIKSLMDCGCIFIFFGISKVVFNQILGENETKNYTFECILKANAEDVKNRLMHILLKDVPDTEEMRTVLGEKGFNEKAINNLFGATDSDKNHRVRGELIEECLEEAKALGIEVIDREFVEKVRKGE